MQTDQATSRVLAVLVVHDGAPWLERSLAGIAAQTHPHLDVLAVDNGSTDGSRAILIEHLGEDHVLVAERDLGFGAAVSMALDTALAHDADHLMFLHDDLELDAGAIELLASHLDADPRLAVVGCKLVDWDEPRRLQGVGLSIDVTGRADPGLEEDELDQGQRDAVQRALYVSTAGMMVRRDAFEALGRFDRRYHLFRDDLDLCWRAWLAGHEVEVIPDAVGRHQASATNYGRLGQTAFIGPRYFAERNTLATLLKNYSLPRLAYVVPLYLLVGIAKVIGFVVTRRVSDAWQTIRAWIWNLWHLRETLRLRRVVQSGRVRTDAELQPLFAKVTTRLRAYAEAIGDWVAGGEVDFDSATAPEEVGEPDTATERLVALVRRRPVTSAAVVLLVFGIVVAFPLLRGGTLRGGDLAPWPAAASTFLSSYVSSWHTAGGFGTAAPPSPAQALLGVVGFLAAGSAWLAPRLLLLGAVPAAWVLSLRAGRAVTPRRLPRLVAATAYALSPPVLAALRAGRIGTLVVAVTLPALIVALTTVLRSSAAPATAWRNTSAAAIAAAVMVAFEPVTALGLLVLLLVALAVASAGPARAGRRVVTRLLGFAIATFLLLFPWSVSLLRPGSPVFDAFAPTGADAQPFWRWLLLAPDLPGFPGILAGVGLLVAGLLGIAFGAPARPRLAAGLWAVAILGAFGAWGLARAGDGAWAWAGLPALLTAAAFAGLLALAFAAAAPQLESHDFGWRHVASVVTAAVVAVGLVASLVTVTRSPWEGYALADTPLPSFIAAEEASVGPFRVLVLSDDGETVAWDLTGAEGPTMAGFGVPRPEPLVGHVQRVVDDVLGGSDPGAAGRLGVANVRYVVVPETGRSERLERALGEQLGLEPQPVADGRLFQVDGWLPRVAVVDRFTALTVSRRGEIPSDADVTPLTANDPTRYEVAEGVPRGGTVLIAEPSDGGWEAATDGVPVAVTEEGVLARADLPGASDYVLVAHDQQQRRTGLVLLQLFFLLTTVSLMLRPPRFAQEDRP